ncbi:MAG: hypothetical protein ACRDRS_15545 [Pseudonocardiaceae bacterium]
MIKDESSRRASLSIPKGWEKLDPESRDRFSLEVEREEKNRRRMEIAELVVRVFGQVCAMSAVIVLALLAKYFADHGAATQGAGIIVGGASSVVAIFVTGRISRRH